MRIDTKEVVKQYHQLRKDAGLPSADPKDAPKLAKELTQILNQMEIRVQSPITKSSMENLSSGHWVRYGVKGSDTKKVIAIDDIVLVAEDDQDGDLRFRNGEDQVYCSDRKRWIKHDNPEWIAMRKAFEHQKEESIITVAEAFKNAGMKDLTPDQIKEFDKPMESPTEEALKEVLTAGDWVGYGKTIEDVKKVTAIDNTVLVTESDQPKCKRCNCEHLDDVLLLRASLESIGKHAGEHGMLSVEKLEQAVVTEFERLRTEVSDLMQQQEKMAEAALKQAQEIYDYSHGVAVVALMKRIDELETELLEYQNLRERMISDKETVRGETQEAGKQIDSLTAANKAQGKHYRTEVKQLKLRIERRHAALVAAGVQLEEKGEKVVVSQLAWQDREPVVFRSNQASPAGEWCLCGAHIRHHFHAQGASHRCPTVDMLEAMNRAAPGYGPVNEDPLIGPDLKPHDKMDRQQLLAEVKRLERPKATVDNRHSFNRGKDSANETCLDCGWHVSRHLGTEGRPFGVGENWCP